MSKDCIFLLIFAATIQIDSFYPKPPDHLTVNLNVNDSPKDYEQDADDVKDTNIDNLEFFNDGRETDVVIQNGASSPIFEFVSLEGAAAAWPKALGFYKATQETFNNMTIFKRVGDDDMFIYANKDGYWEVNDEPGDEAVILSSVRGPTPPSEGWKYFHNQIWNQDQTLQWKLFDKENLKRCNNSPCFWKNDGVGKGYKIMDNGYCCPQTEEINQGLCLPLKSHCEVIDVAITTEVPPNREVKTTTASEYERTTTTTSSGPTKATGPKDYLGCYANLERPRLYADKTLMLIGINSKRKCRNECLMQHEDTHFIGLEMGNICRCGTYPPPSKNQNHLKVSDDYCEEYRCPGDTRTYCGGDNFIKMFRL